MTTYGTEAEVILFIKERLAGIGSMARVSVHSDRQSENSIVRTVVFQATVAMDGSETIVNAMADIGTETDRGIIKKNRRKISDAFGVFTRPHCGI